MMSTVVGTTWHIDGQPLTGSYWALSFKASTSRTWTPLFLIRKRDLNSCSLTGLMLLHDDCNGQPPLKSFPAHTCAWSQQAFLAILPTRSQRKEAGQDSAVTSEMKTQHHPSERTVLPTTCLEGGDFSSLRQKMPLGEQDHSGRRAGETSADSHSPHPPVLLTHSHASCSATVTVPLVGSSSSHPEPPPLQHHPLQRQLPSPWRIAGAPGARIGRCAPLSLRGFANECFQCEPSRLRAETAKYQHRRNPAGGDSPSLFY